MARQAFPAASPVWPLLEQPPRVRVEWVVAVARVVLATGAMVAIAVDQQQGLWPTYVAGCYLVYALGIVALVWSPVRFSRSWDIGLHLLDLLAFSVLIVATNGATSPFFVSLLFLLVCATTRWEHRGTLWTGAAAAGVYAGVSANAYLFDRPGFDMDTFVIRVASLVVMTTLLAYLASHQRRFQGEIGHLAAWPRGVSRDRTEVLSEILTRVAEFMRAPRVLLTWTDPDDGRRHIAWRSNGEVLTTSADDDAFGSVVLPQLEGRSFHTTDAAVENAHVVSLTRRGFLRRQCHPIDERFRVRFGIHAVQSWPLDGEIVHGRLFCLDRSAMPLDDLVLGELVASVAASRLDSFYLLDRLRAASALETRVRVARDLHDSLLQSQAGAALQLLAARRMLDRDVPAAKQRLQEIQGHLERGEMEMRSFIRGLRPIVHVPGSAKGLRTRLHELREQLKRQWTVGVEFTLDDLVDGLSSELAEQVFRLIQEGVVNAARHADASAISVDLSIKGSNVQLTISDDGKGFPFSGTYDLAALGRMNQGPTTLKERVTELRGGLTLTSESNTGTRLSITVPCAQN